MSFEIFSYWNTTELITLFNALAALTNSADFFGLLRLLVMIGVFSVAMVILGGGLHLEQMWRWVILVTFFHSLLLVPKATVVIVDRTSANPNPQSVANVPVGIASLVSATTKIGDYLT